MWNLLCSTIFARIFTLCYKKFYVSILSNINGIANVIEYWNQGLLMIHDAAINKSNKINDDGDDYNHTSHKWDEIDTDAIANRILLAFEGVEHYTIIYRSIRVQ